MTDVAAEATVSRRTRAWVGPVSVAAAGLVGAAYVATNNPSGGAAYLPCPFYGLTGLWCPGCGLTRASHLLLNGDVPGALGMNLFLPVVVGILGYAWLAWFSGTLGRPLPSLGRVRPWVWTVLYVAAIAFAVLRNLPAFAVLAP